MSTLDEIRQGLVESGLMNEETADGYYAAWQTQHEEEQAQQPPDRRLEPADEAEAFVHWLIESELLTELHGEAILAGFTGPFVLGPYLVREQIASGRSGGIFRAVHEEFEQPVSLKVFPRAVGSNPELLARIGREARIMSVVDHPNVIRSFQAGKLGDIYFLALENLSGQTLQEKLQRERRLPYDQACRLIRDVARGLASLHEHEVIHRDLRPANIWVGSDGRPKIMEFGASVDALAYLDELSDDEQDETFTAGEMVINKYDYMPPEQAYDESCADALSDIYALGCIFYHCLTGRPPFVEKNPIKKVLRHVFDKPQPPSQLFGDIPRPIDDTVGGMLAKQYEQRFQKADEVVWALSNYVGQEDEPTNNVAVVDVSAQYLEWAQSHQTVDERRISDETAGASPELTRFLDFVSKRSGKRAR